MKLQKSIVVWVMMLVVTWLLIARPDWTSAQEAPAADAPSASLQVVSLANGRTGFFDPSTKRLYVYGPDLRMSVMIVEVDTLGAPLRLIQRTAQ
jgi:hypothetical protein